MKLAHCVRGMGASLAIVASAALLSACGEDKFDAGQCVTIKDGITNDDLEDATCRESSPAEQLDGDGIYQVSQVVEFESSCPRATDVTFNHEPDDATYCLNTY